MTLKIRGIGLSILAMAIVGGAEASAQTFYTGDFCTPSYRTPPPGWTPDMDLCYDEFDKLTLYFENGGTVQLDVDPEGRVQGVANGGAIEMNKIEPEIFGLISYAASRCFTNAACTRYAAKFAEGVGWWMGGNCANSYLQTRRCRPFGG